MNIEGEILCGVDFFSLSTLTPLLLVDSQSSLNANIAFAVIFLCAARNKNTRETGTGQKNNSEAKYEHFVGVRGARDCVEKI